MNKLQRKKQIQEHALELSPTPFRRARTRTLIQLGGLVEKAGLTDFFDLPLGADLQKEHNLEKSVAAFMGALVILSNDLQAGEYSRVLLEIKGLKALANRAHEI